MDLKASGLQTLSSAAHPRNSSPRTHARCSSYAAPILGAVATRASIARRRVSSWSPLGWERQRNRRSCRRAIGSRRSDLVSHASVRYRRPPDPTRSRGGPLIPIQETAARPPPWVPPTCNGQCLPLRAPERPCPMVLSPSHEPCKQPVALMSLPPLERSFRSWWGPTFSGRRVGRRRDHNLVFGQRLGTLRLSFLIACSSSVSVSVNGMIVPHARGRVGILITAAE